MADSMESGAEKAMPPKNKEAAHNSSAAIGVKLSPPMEYMEQNGNIKTSGMTPRD